MCACVVGSLSLSKTRPLSIFSVQGGKSSLRIPVPNNFMVYPELLMCGACTVGGATRPLERKELLFLSSTAGGGQSPS